MTAPRYPEGVTAGQLLPKIKQAGVIVAGGLHPQIKSEYFRIGHMGAVRLGDLLATIGALETALAQTDYVFEKGAGVAAVMASA
jgi:alanine-glyoxylate transaminase/serine-glyoxylate transaminase/serine-pyruvate transaminase